MDESGDDSEDAIREHGMRLLARREHSRQELTAKLVRKGWSREAVQPVLSELETEGLLSEARFTEQFVRARLEAGYGPLRIYAELGERGVDNALAAPYLDLGDEAWRERCFAVWERRFGLPPRDRREQARQSRFLANRGFSGDHVRRVLEDVRRSDDIPPEDE